MTAELQTVIKRLQENINLAPSKFLKYSEEELRRKPAPNKWSKKELLGHLIDSAANNHHRFIKIQFLPAPFFLWPRRYSHQAGHIVPWHAHMPVKLFLYP